MNATAILKKSIVHITSQELVDSYATASNFGKNLISQLLKAKGKDIIDPLIDYVKSSNNFGELIYLINVFSKLGQETVDKLFDLLNEEYRAQTMAIRSLARIGGKKVERGSGRIPAVVREIPAANIYCRLPNS